MDGAAGALEKWAGAKVVARATSIVELLPQVRERAPDVVLIDPWMHDGEGLDAIAAMRDAYPALTIIALSPLQQSDRVERALERGADGYVGKDIPADDLAALVRRVHAGVVVRPRAVRYASRSLTQREAQVIQLVAEGLSNGDVATRLFVSEQTVKFHLSNIYRKLGAHNRTEAARIALRMGLIN